MPWSLHNRGGKWCVVKEGEQEPVPGGCHDSRAQAVKHMRALYANEPGMTAAMDMHMPRFQVGDTVRILDGHEPEQQGMTATVQLVSPETAYGLRMQEEGEEPELHKWYVDSELELAEEDTMETMASAVTAAAAPVAPPAEFFNQPEADEPTPLTYEDDGRVYGHLALWGSCHTGFLNGAFAECVKPPSSRTDYAHFHLGQIRTAEGDDVRIGKVTYATGHAPLRAGLQAASRHYDDTGSVGAFVRARDGQHGIWLSGVLRSDLSLEGLRDLRANPPSGDWRSFNHHLELIASLAVPVPGFPIPKVELALAASGEGTEVDALILPSWTVEQEGAAEMRSREYLRRRHALSAAVRR